MSHWGYLAVAATQALRRRPSTARCAGWFLWWLDALTAAILSCVLAPGVACAGEVATMPIASVTAIKAAVTVAIVSVERVLRGILCFMGGSVPSCFRPSNGCRCAAALDAGPLGVPFITCSHVSVASRGREWGVCRPANTDTDCRRCLVAGALSFE